MQLTKRVQLQLLDEVERTAILQLLFAKNRRFSTGKDPKWSCFRVRDDEVCGSALVIHQQDDERIASVL